jgi:hypothetical protein
MDKRIRLLPDAYEKLAYYMRFPGQLRGVGNVLPLAASIREQGIHGFDSLRGRTQDF